MEQAVLGMAKSNLDLKGAKTEKLQVDFFKLCYGIAKHRAAGQRVHAVLLVMTDEIKKRCETWKEKYGEPDITVSVAPLKREKIQALEDEKERNRRGLKANGGTDSVASAGKEIGEKALAAFIQGRFPAVKQEQRDPLTSIDWDYYGVIAEQPAEGTAGTNGTGRPVDQQGSGPTEQQRQFFLRLLNEREKRKDGMTFAEIQAYVREERDSWE